MKKFLIKIAKKIFYASYYPYALVSIGLLYNKAHRKGHLTYLSDRDFDVWKTSILNIIKEHCSSNFGFGTRLVYETFAKAKIDVIRCREYDNKDLPIVVLCVKNDLKRLEMLVKHYREIGVERFAFLDNGSTDGTYDWMLKQEDIDVFKTLDQYNNFAKEGWLNRVISYYGFSRWYILTDSDELFTYIGMENHPLSDLISYAKKDNIKRFRGINLEMYADAALFSLDSNKIDIKKTYCWMDSSGYVEVPRKIGNSIITDVLGGPRRRTMNVPVTIIKHPLVYFEEGTISVNAHYQFPYTLIEDSPFIVGILHYKFLDYDKKEFERRAKFATGMNAGNSKTAIYNQGYLNAVNENSSMSFMYEGSVQYKDSSSLKKIPLIESVKFGEEESHG